MREILAMVGETEKRGLWAVFIARKENDPENNISFWFNVNKEPTKPNPSDIKGRVFIRLAAVSKVLSKSIVFCFFFNVHTKMYEYV